MRFILIDRILECVPGEYIVTKKNLTLAEEYLESLYTAKYETKFDEIYGKIDELPKKYNILTLK